MTVLRQKMIDAKRMQLRGLSERTQETYVRVVRQLAEYYHKPPDQLSEAELRQYLLYLKNDKKAARSTCTQTLCGLKFFYQQTLHRHWPILDFVRPSREHQLPVVLSRAEVQQILGCLRRPSYRVCLSTIYSCGLRLLEGVRLQVDQIDSSSAKRGFAPAAPSAKGTKIGMCRCRSERWSCCGVTGSATGNRCGCFPVYRGGRWRGRAGPWMRVGCSEPFGQP
jgi:hypothetical protein